MSILIKDIEMPAGCHECILYEHQKYTGLPFCKAVGKRLVDDYKTRSYDGKPDWCPLVELPETHGDLIDRDAMKKDYRMGNDCNKCETNWKSCQYDQIYTKMDFCGWLDDVNVVIEAEGEGWTDLKM